MKVLWGKKQHFYKANLHMHTTLSDGTLSPEEVKAAYLAAGYSVVAFTDHDIMIPHNDLTDENFVAITSYEAAINEDREEGYDFLKTFHLNFYSKDPEKTVPPCFAEKNVFLEHSRAYMTEEMKRINYPLRYGTDAINEMIAKSNADGFLVCYNHPRWSIQSYPDYIGLQGLWGVEIFNTGSGLAMEESVHPYDDLLRVGNRLCPVAADDSHSPRSHFGGFVMLEADRLDYASVMEALENGDLYASAGPELKSICIDGNKCIVECSNVRAICLSTERRLSRCVERKGDEPLVRAEMDLTRYFREARERNDKTSPAYLRIMLIDDAGRKAYSRAYYEDEWRGEASY